MRSREYFPSKRDDRTDGDLASLTGTLGLLEGEPHEILVLRFIPFAHVKCAPPFHRHCPNRHSHAGHASTQIDFAPFVKHAHCRAFLIRHPLSAMIPAP